MVSLNILETEILTMEVDEKKRDSTRAHLHSILLWATVRVACVGPLHAQLFFLGRRICVSSEMPNAYGCVVDSVASVRTFDTISI